MQLMRVAGCGFTEILGSARLSVRRARQQTTLRHQLCLNGELLLNRNRFSKGPSRDMNSSRPVIASPRADHSNEIVLDFYMDSSQFKRGAGRYAISRFAIENYPRWIRIAELGSVRDSTSSGEKRIFAIASRPIAAEVKGKAIRRIVSIITQTACAWFYSPAMM
jgi:hypothetical protein